jgi:sugar lactone lactonase YvrE
MERNRSCGETKRLMQSRSKPIEDYPIIGDGRGGARRPQRRHRLALLAAQGRLRRARPFAEIGVPGHVPDGAAMDEKDCYWCAIHGGGILRRYAPDGELLASPRLPISQPTMCAFVGPALGETVVTSARERLTREQFACEPHAGSVLRFRPGVRGLPQSCVAR